MQVKNERTVAVVMHPSALHAIEVMDRIWWAVTGEHMRVTGLGEEGHSKGSRHYGLIGDIRCRAFDIDADDDRCTPEQRKRVHRLARERLGSEYDLVWERLSTPHAHLHIEFDPKPI